MKEITITMTLRTVDKKIRVLELISQDNSKRDCISNIEIKEMTDDELTDIMKKLEQLNLLKLQNTDLVSIPNESPRNEIVVYYTNINTEKIKGLLKKMRSKYPKLKEPLIGERPLRKIAKLFSNLDTKDEIIALLKRCAVPKILIKSQHMQTEMIFRILNHYAWSAKKEDYKILTKIMGEFVRPIMFDGNKKEAQGMENMLNGLLEDDGFIIKIGHLQKISEKEPGINNMVNSKISNALQEEYVISIKDREIWINNYLISRPHAVGSNIEFFLYLLDNPDKEIKKVELPADLRNQLSKKSFSKILHALGFKGEILKTFFPKRSKSILSFKQRVDHNYIVDKGIKEAILLEELKLAHTKNNPK